jgi:hypothetical protein
VRSRSVLVPVLLLWSAAAAATERCVQRPDLVGHCFSVRGRAALYNGTPTVRIWRVGTTRLLGVSARGCVASECETAAVPAAIRGILDWDRPVFGDFVVCPFTRQRPGAMQFVCVDSVTRIRPDERTR